MSSAFDTFADVQAHLAGLGMYHMDLGLSRVEEALERLGLAAQPYRAAHVVGTNGKGSVSLYLAETARAHGLRTGLYASPHFVSVRERVQVDGRMLGEETWVRLGNEVLAASGPDGLTYFEFVTVLAALAFARAGVEFAVLEAGLGGRHDATRALGADLVAFSSIGLDHTAILGPTLAHIARDKAGALRPGAPALTTPQVPEARDALAAEARALGVALRLPEDVPGPLPEPLRPGMPGPHQEANARLALAAWRALAPVLGRAVDPEACARALAGAHLPGRFQRVPGPPELILDGAHNPPALAALAAALQELGMSPSLVAFGCMADKDLATMAPQVAALGRGPILAVGMPHNERAMPAFDLAAALGPRATPVADMGRALPLLSRDPGPVLICGSLYLLGEFFALRPDLLGYDASDLEL
ncbi:bifunctional folylpolyglutamate synthase/dihydrofolate synthase [Desulfocurvus sp. DL9XJH121]